MLPMLVALRGRVDSKDSKKCELSDRQAVIHEVSPLQLGPQHFCILHFH